MKIRAIAIDDDPVSLFLLKKMTDKVQYLDLMATYADPIEGAAGIILDEPDVVFLDMEMPEFNGLDIMKALVKTPKIVVISGSPHFEAAALGLNAVSFLHKPLAEEEFHVVLKEVYESLLQA